MRWLSTLTLALVFSFGASRAPAASVDGLNIYSAKSGSGKATVVLVHGWTCLDMAAATHRRTGNSRWTSSRARSRP